MKQTYKSAIVVVIHFLVFHSLTCFSQEVKTVSDLRLWSGIELVKEVGNNLEFSLQEEVRLRKDISELDKIFTQFGAEYKIKKNLVLEFKYRYTKDYAVFDDDKEFFRYSLGFKYRYSMNHFDVDYRLRFQKETDSFNVIGYKNNYEIFFRNKLQIKYNGVKKIQPFLSVESFQKHTLYNIPEYDMIRSQAGVKLKINSYGSLRFAYALDHELNSEVPYNYGIMKINYQITF